MMNWKVMGLMLVFIPSFGKLWSQNDLPLRPAERVAAYQAEAAIDYRLKPLTPTKQRSSRIPELETAGLAHTLLDIDVRQIEQLLGDAPEALQLELPTSARSEVVLDLVRVELFTSDFTVVESGGGTAAAAPGLHYRGIVRGDENSLVAISIFPGEVMGMISTATENLVVGRRHGAGGEEQHVVYDDRRIPPPGDYECQTPDDQLVYDREELAPPTDGARGGSSNCVRLYWEADYSIFVKHGSSSAVQSFMTGLFNQVATLYANESVNLTLSQLYVWTTADPFNFSSASDMLNAFKSTRTTFNGDLAGLISFESSGGIAYVDALCNTKYAYGFMSIQNSYATAPTYSWSVNCVAHEFGHLLGSQHTHACVWNGNGTAIDGCYTPQGSCAKPGLPTGGGTIMSYCHLTSVGVNFTLGFGSQPGNLIRNRVSNATCLTTCTTSGGGTTTPPPPPPSTTGVAIQSDTIALATSGPSNWMKVTFAQAFSQKPIVVVGAPSYNEVDPTAVRVRNVSTTGFEVQLDEWNYLNGIHATETVTYIAATPGVHSLNGITLLAGNVDGVTNLVKAVTFSKSFSSTPVVLATQVTNNDANATTVRLSSITTTQFRVRVQEQEKTTDSGKHNAESVNYIALSLGSGTLGDRPVWVGRTGRSVSNNWTTFTFGKSFSTVPTLIAASQSVYDSNPAAVRYRTLQGTSVQLMMEEEKSQDTEVTHAAEVIGVFVIGRTANNTTTTGGTCPPINFNQQPVLSFGGTQDAGTSSIQDGGITLMIQNNAWKAIALNYTVTPNTVIEFDFKSTLQGEVHGLGFDTDNSISSNFTFRVYGTQTWGYSNYNNYAAGAGTWKTYRIPVGQFYTGTFTRLFFAADNDAGARTGNSYFRNVRLYEGSTCTSLLEGAGFAADEILEGQPARLFPNPAADELTLSFSSVQPGAADVEVYSVTGQLLQRRNLQSGSGHQQHRLDVTSLPAGAYFLRLTTADGQETLPFVVARR